MKKAENDVSLFLNLPVEMLLEICRKLDNKSLLILSAVNKYLNQIIFSEKALWQLPIGGYELQKIVDINVEYEPNTIYFKIKENFKERKKLLKYYVINPQGELVNGKVNLDWRKIWTTEKLEAYLPDLLPITSQRGHTYLHNLAGSVKQYLIDQRINKVLSPSEFDDYNDVAERANYLLESDDLELVEQLKDKVLAIKDRQLTNIQNLNTLHWAPLPILFGTFIFGSLLYEAIFCPEKCGSLTEEKAIHQCTYQRDSCNLFINYLMLYLLGLASGFIIKFLDNFVLVNFDFRIPSDLTSKDSTAFDKLKTFFYKCISYRDQIVLPTSIYYIYTLVQSYFDEQNDYNRCLSKYSEERGEIFQACLDKAHDKFSIPNAIVSGFLTAYCLFSTCYILYRIINSTFKKVINIGHQSLAYSKQCQFFASCGINTPEMELERLENESLLISHSV